VGLHNQETFMDADEKHEENTKIEDLARDEEATEITNVEELKIFVENADKSVGEIEKKIAGLVEHLHQHIQEASDARKRLKISEDNLKILSKKVDEIIQSSRRSKLSLENQIKIRKDVKIYLMMMCIMYLRLLQHIAKGMVMKRRNAQIRAEYQIVDPEVQSLEIKLAKLKSMQSEQVFTICFLKNITLLRNL
jgi:hypothetical protein